jgi:hypothetical protein
MCKGVEDLRHVPDGVPRAVLKRLCAILSVAAIAASRRKGRRRRGAPGPPRLLHDAGDQISVSPDHWGSPIQPRKGADQPPCKRGEAGQPGVAPQVEHPEPSGHEENAGLRSCLKPRRLEEPAELAGRERLLPPEGVQASRVKQAHEEGAQEQIELVGNADDGGTPGFRVRNSSRTAIS